MTVKRMPGILFLVACLGCGKPTDERPAPRIEGRPGKASEPKAPAVVPAPAPEEAVADVAFPEVAARDRSAVEVGGEGHHDFWFRNQGAGAAEFELKAANCACAEVDVGLVSRDVWNAHLVRSATANCLGAEAHAILGVANALALGDRIEWKWLTAGKDAQRVSVPGAPTSADPQVGVVRLKWKGRPAEAQAPKALLAVLGVREKGGRAADVELRATYAVVAPFFAHVPDAERAELRLPDLGPNASATREIYFWSATRTELPLLFRATAEGGAGRCVEIGRPTALTAGELVEFSGRHGLPVPALCAYRVSLTVHERRNKGKVVLHRLPTGPLRFELLAAVADPVLPDSVVPVAVHGNVLGGLRIFTERDRMRAAAEALGRALPDLAWAWVGVMGPGGPTGEVDFGSFPGNAARSRRVTIVCDRADAGLKVVEREPAFLAVELKRGPKADGRGEWELRATIPPRALFGRLDRSWIVVETDDAPPERLKIPVRAFALVQ